MIKLKPNTTTVYEADIYNDSKKYVAHCFKNFMFGMFTFGHTQSVAFYVFITVC